MIIVKAPTKVYEFIEIPRYDYSIIENVCDRIDRFLGGNPPERQPTHTVRIVGRVRFSDGTLMPEDGEILEIGVKVKEPIIDSATGHTYHGIVPLYRDAETGLIHFCVDHFTV